MLYNKLLVASWHGTMSNIPDLDNPFCTRPLKFKKFSHFFSTHPIKRLKRALHNKGAVHFLYISHVVWGLQFYSGFERIFNVKKQSSKMK